MIGRNLEEISWAKERNSHEISVKVHPLARDISKFSGSKLIDRPCPLLGFIDTGDDGGKQVLPCLFVIPFHQKHTFCNFLSFFFKK